jgi:hypothetical protein
MITIVSGIPRSGTSMMMQMLVAGGMPVLTDHLRVADADNPKGYLEWEAAKRLPREPHLIAEAEGKCVKIVAQLLFALPAGHEYQVVFMNRELNEVVASQSEMTQRLGTTVKGLSSDMLLKGLQMHLRQVTAWLQGRSDIRVEDVEYKKVLADPQVTIARVCEFLRQELDQAAMLQQVDQRLYRHRAGSLSAR